MEKIALVSLVLLALALPVSAQNIVSIGDHVVDPGNEIRVPLLLNDSTGVAAATVRINYDPAVVRAYSNAPTVDKGDFTGFYASDNSQNASGYITINVMDFSGTLLTGDLVIGYVRLQAVGSPGSSSMLDITIETLEDDISAVDPRSEVDGSFAIPGPSRTPAVSVNITGIGVIGQSTANIAKVEYTGFSAGEDYNISVYHPNGTKVYFDSGTLSGEDPQIIPVNWIPAEQGNYNVTAFGSGIIGSVGFGVYDSGVLPVVPELATIVLVSAGMLGLFAMRRYKKE